MTANLHDAIVLSLEDIVATAPTPTALPTRSVGSLGPAFEADTAHGARSLRRPLLAAAAVMVVLGGVVSATRHTGVVTVGRAPAGLVTAVTLADTPAAPVAPPQSSAMTVTTVTTMVPKTTLSRTLSKGLAASEDVRVMQQRLNDLHFDVGAIDGIFGANTEMAVWAYQSLILNLIGKDVTGQVTPELWDRMQDPLGLPIFRPDASPTHAEIFLPAQAMVLYTKGELRLITHVSSGSGQKWCDEYKNVPAWPGATTTTVPPGQKNPRYCGTSITPGGVFKVYLKRNGWVDIPLGRVYNAISFNAGIAIHGYPEVPKSPASHGCIRVPMHVSTYLPDLLHNGDQIFVWDGVKEPEVYGDQKPPVDERDPTDTTIAATTFAPTTAAPGTAAPTSTAPSTTPPNATAAPKTTTVPTTVVPTTTLKPSSTIVPTTVV